MSARCPCIEVTTNVARVAAMCAIWPYVGDGRILDDYLDMLREGNMDRYRCLLVSADMGLGSWGWCSSFEDLVRKRPERYTLVNSPQHMVAYILRHRRAP